MSHNSKLQKVDLIKLNIGDVYWPAKANSKPFKVVEQDPTGYYLACFRGNETEATYIWNGKGMQWFEENCKTQIQRLLG